MAFTRFIKGVALYSFIVFSLVSVAYFIFFTRHLSDLSGNYQNFKGVIATDSFMYTGQYWTAIDVKNLSLEEAWHWLKTYPTLLPTTVLTYMLSLFNVNPLIFNMILYFLSTILVFKASGKLHFSARYSVIFMLLNTQSIFFVQSFTKEPLLIYIFSLLIFGLAHEKKRYVILSLLGVSFVRLPLLIPIFSGLFFNMAFEKYEKNPLKKIMITSFIALEIMILPIVISFTGIYKAAKIMLININTQSGVTYSYIQNMRIPGAIYIFLPIKMVQNFFEPLLSLSIYFSQSQIDLSYTLSLGGAILNMIFILFMIHLCFFRYYHFKNLLKNRPFRLSIVILVSICIFISALPFTHMRYLYPLAPLMGFILDYSYQSKERART